jgi:hypothetical protein
MRSESEHQPLVQRWQHFPLAEVDVQRVLDPVGQRVHPALAHTTEHQATQRVRARHVDQLSSPATAGGREYLLSPLVDRSHRIGHAQPVTAWRIIAAQTIDARIAELIDSKAGLAAQALDGSEEEVRASAEVQHEALVTLLTEALSAAPTHLES